MVSQMVSWTGKGHLIETKEAETKCGFLVNVLKS